MHDIFDRMSHLTIPTLVMPGTHDNQALLAFDKANAARIRASDV
ncbi:MAG: hypothetical protein AB8B94_17340 [Hyphomicrobiales bacterium]